MSQSSPFFECVHCTVHAPSNECGDLKIRKLIGKIELYTGAVHWQIPEIWCYRQHWPTKGFRYFSVNFYNMHGVNRVVDWRHDHDISGKSQICIHFSRDFFSFLLFISSIRRWVWDSAALPCVFVQKVPHISQISLPDWQWSFKDCFILHAAADSFCFNLD